MRKNLIKILCCGAVLSLSAACSDDGPEPGKDIVPEGEGKMDAMTISEQADFLEETAKLVLGGLNPEDQKELVLNAAFANAAYGKLQAPAEWREFAEKVKEYLEATLKGSGSIQGDSAASSGANAATSSETRSATNTVVPITFSDFAGIYTPGSGEWVHSGDSKNIEFRFLGPDGEEQSIVAVPSDETFLYSFVSEKWNGNDVAYTSTAIYLPTGLNVTYNVHGDALAEIDLNYKVDKLKNGTFNASGTLRVTASNLSSTFDFTADNRLLTAQISASLSNREVAKGAIAARGNHLTDLQHIMLLPKLKDVAMLVKNAEAYVDILGRVQINGKLTMNDRLFDMHPVIVPGVIASGTADAEKAVEETAKTLNKYTKVWMRFNNTRTEQSRLEWTHRAEVLPEGTVYNVVPQLYVPADKTAYDFTTLAATEFADTATALQHLIAAYKAAIGL